MPAIWKACKEAQLANMKNKRNRVGDPYVGYLTRLLGQTRGPVICRWSRLGKHLIQIRDPEKFRLGYNKNEYAGICTFFYYVQYQLYLQVYQDKPKLGIYKLRVKINHSNTHQLKDKMILICSNFNVCNTIQAIKLNISRKFFKIALLSILTGNLKFPFYIGKHKFLRKHMS